MQSGAGGMNGGVGLHYAVLINTLGHGSGLVLFGVLIVLLLRGYSKHATRERRASIAAALLAFLWNLGSLAGLALSQKDGAVPELLVALNFSFLTLLPAVLWSVVLGQRYRALVWCGYALSMISVSLHFGELMWPPARLHQLALLSVAGGFLLLAAMGFVLAKSERESLLALADLLCLGLFALSFLHFGYGHSQTAWTEEIAWHHAGILLALIVLLRDYRLLMLETFIRFLVNAGLAAVWALGFYWVDVSGRALERVREDGFATGLLLIGFCGSLVFFAQVRTRLQKDLTRRLFRRRDLNEYFSRLLQIASECRSERDLLEHGAALIAEFVEAERFVLVQGPNGKQANSWAEVELPLWLSRGEAPAVLLGARRAGRRYLLEDLESLHHLSALLAEQVERLRASELEMLAREAELRALQAQVNPHFLFNALNTLYGIIGRESVSARGLVLNLAELLRYCLQRGRHLIPVGEELQIVKAYLEIESLRLQERLTFAIEAGEGTHTVPIPALSIQPLVENAIKHGISRRSKGGNVQVVVAEDGALLRVQVRDNGPGFQTAESAVKGLGTGLNNVRERLRLRYGKNAGLQILSDSSGATVRLAIPLSVAE